MTTRMVTLPEMLGKDLADWVINEQNTGRLTLPKLKAKLRENEEFLLKREVVADYAYYAIQHVFSSLGHPIPEK